MCPKEVKCFTPKWDAPLIRWCAQSKMCLNSYTANDGVGAVGKTSVAAVKDREIGRIAARAPQAANSEELSGFISSRRRDPSA